MPFKTPITIAEVLGHIQAQDHVLPAIQREFVWDQDQMTRLFDSLLRGYPIGSFLFWKVQGAHSTEFKFYGFIKNYHQLTAPHCPLLDVPAGKAITAILDGQQRLTALNIGLRGSHAPRLPGKWANNPASYPKQTLFLNLCAPAPENELGMMHDFRFFATPPAPDPASGVYWFPVTRILEPGLSDGPTIFAYLLKHSLNNDPIAFGLLDSLRKTVHDSPLINYYEEQDQSIDKVLNIFIRVNSGGEVLSYSDLLLSIATAQWKNLDARDAVHSLVDRLNAIGQGFAFTKDIVLKSGLVLTEVSDVGFKVSNFNNANMAKLEQNWAGVEQQLHVAAGLLADFGLSAATLPANSVIIPVAYYVHRRQLDDTYRTAPKFSGDRQLLRSWVVRSLVKAGIWGSGLDTLLRELRRVIADSGHDGFPLAAIESAMAARGKPLTFSTEEIDDMVETSYGHKRAFPLLALLFPAVDTHNLFHLDHVFPQALFKKTTLTTAGVPVEQIAEVIQMANSLPNLQLLEGPDNIGKQDKLPLAWATERFKDPANLAHYLDSQDLTGLPDTLGDFEQFYEVRKRRLADRLRGLLRLASPVV